MIKIPYLIVFGENLFLMGFGLPGGTSLENDGDHKVLKFSAVVGACHHGSLS